MSRELRDRLEKAQAELAAWPVDALAQVQAEQAAAERELAAGREERAALEADLVELERSLPGSPHRVLPEAHRPFEPSRIILIATVLLGTCLLLVRLLGFLR